MMVEQSAIRVHPLSDIFPAMPDAEYKQLAKDIARNGLLEDILLFDEQILDGRHRYRACIDNDIEPRFRKYEGDDPVGVALALNLHRRQLTAGQRALIAAELADEKPGGARVRAQKCALTHAEAAELCSISARQVDKASIFLNSVASGRAAEQLLEAVRSNRFSLNRAEKIARLPKEKQLQILAGASPFKSDRRRVVGHLREDRSEKIDRPAELLAAKIARLAGRARKAEKSTPEFWDGLASLCVSASPVFVQQARRLSWTPSESTGMPFDEI
jgi:ParB-like chromosome segregation protein Spo0J